MAFAWEMSAMQCPACDRDNEAGARFCAGCGAALDGEAEDTLVGRVLGERYVVRRKIAEGGMGVVYEAEQRMGSMLRRVAIKTLLPGVSRDRKLVARFYRECGMVSQLDHPNTIRFYDFGQTADGALYVAMEYVDGRELGDVIHEGPLPIDRTLHIVRQVCGALHEAHEKGIVHRDLKPDNIVLTERAGERDFVKLLDFGIATRASGAATAETKLTQYGTVLGTPPYMSPEQLAGEPVDRRSDVYSLGIIVYEMLTGRLPFEADTPLGWANQHMTASPRPMQGVPRALQRAVLHALAKVASDRPATAPAFLYELERAAESRTLDDAPERPGDTAPEEPHTSLMPSVPATDLDTSGRTVRAPTLQPVSHAPLVQTGRRKRPRRGRAMIYLLGLMLTAGGVAGAVALTAGRDFSAPATPEPAKVETSAPAPTQIEPVVEPERPSPTVPVVERPREPEPDKPSVVKRRPPAKSEPSPTLPPPLATDPAPPVTPPPATPPPASVPPPAPQPPPVSMPRLPLPPRPAHTTQPAPPATTPQPAAPTPPASGISGDAACQRAQSMAGGADIEGAVAMYRVCQNTGGSPNALNNARGRINAQAPEAVRRRAFNGDCAGARAVVAAAASIGAGGPAQAQLARTSCGG